MIMPQKIQNIGTQVKDIGLNLGNQAKNIGLKVAGYGTAIAVGLGMVYFTIGAMHTGNIDQPTMTFNMEERKGGILKYEEREPYHLGAFFKPVARLLGRHPEGYIRITKDDKVYTYSLDNPKVQGIRSNLLEGYSEIESIIEESESNK